MTELFAIYGANGWGREVLAFTRVTQNIAGKIYFIDDNPALLGQFINGVEVISYYDFINKQSAKKYVCIAISASKIRQTLAQECQRDALLDWSVRATNVFIGDEVLVGPSAILAPFVCLTANVKIGAFFHANLYSYVAHDCIIEDYVTLAPGAKCNGQVIIEQGAYIGAGAIIRQGQVNNPLIIGKYATVGMGAVVTKSVPAYQTVVGNPAKPLFKSELDRK